MFHTSQWIKNDFQFEVSGSLFFTEYKYLRYGRSHSYGCWPCCTCVPLYRAPQMFTQRIITTHLLKPFQRGYLSLIDKLVRLLKRRPILHTGSFVVARFVYWIFFFRIYWAIRVTHSRLSLVYLAIIVAHSSLRVTTNSLLECGPRIR